MGRQLRILPHLALMHLRAQLEYRGAFWIDRIAQVITYASSFAAIWILADRFGGIAGWDWPELMLLFSFHLCGYSLGACLSFTQMRQLEESVRLGTFDTLLIKPINPWAYLVFSGLNPGYTGHVLLGVGMMIWALCIVPLHWSVGLALYFGLALVSAGMVTGALFTIIGATALVWTRSNHLYSVFFGFWELSRYPLSIFPAAIQTALVTLVPLGFMAAVPVAVLLGKPVPILGDWAGPAALLAGPCLVGLAILQWRSAIRRYQGAGG